MLLVVEPSGIYYVCMLIGYSLLLLNSDLQGYNGAAVGKGQQLAKTELEKLKFNELTTREAAIEAARM